ncbi:MAG: hydrolase [Chitinophagales bacterium]
MHPLQLGRDQFGDPAHAGNLPSREQAENLLLEWVPNERLRLHMRQVAGLMRAWAQEQGADEQEQWKWELAGLLHDADWEKWPDRHCAVIIEKLESLHTDPEVIHAIASHGPFYFGVEPVTEMDKMLYAFDELSGFIHAYSLMRPDGYTGMEVKGVQKRLKDKTFASNVSREDIEDACMRAGITREALILFIITHQGNITHALGS